jgi:hypothetical protein
VQECVVSNGNSLNVSVSNVSVMLVSVMMLVSMAVQYRIFIQIYCLNMINYDTMRRVMYAPGHVLLVTETTSPTMSRGGDGKGDCSSSNGSSEEEEVEVEAEVEVDEITDREGDEGAATAGPTGSRVVCGEEKHERRDCFLHWTAGDWICSS